MSEDTVLIGRLRIENGKLRLERDQAKAELTRLREEVDRRGFAVYDMRVERDRLRSDFEVVEAAATLAEAEIARLRDALRRVKGAWPNAGVMKGVARNALKEIT